MLVNSSLNHFLPPLVISPRNHFFPLLGNSSSNHFFPPLINSSSDLLFSSPQVKFIVIRKATGEVVKTRYVSKEPFFVFHHVNAFEVDDKLVVDVIAYEEPSLIDKFYLNKVRQNQYSTEDPAKFKRFVLPMLSDSDLQVSVGVRGGWREGTLVCEIDPSF